MNAALLLSLMLFQQDPGMTPEQELAQRTTGQKYLDKVSAAWSAQLPQERLLGIYMGRHWMGLVRITLKAAPAGSGAAFDYTLHQEIRVLKHVGTVDLHALLDARLAPVSAERIEVNDGKERKSRIALVDGKRTATMDGYPDREVKPGPGFTIEANLLPLWVPPEEDGLFLLCMIGDKGANSFHRLPEKVERTIDGKKQACSVLKIGHLSAHPDLWYYSEDGRPLEFHPQVEEGTPAARHRPITEAMIGKPLNEPLAMKPAERRVLDVFVAIKKNDETALAACFDFDRFAKESIPDFEKVAPADQKKTVVNLRQTMLKNFLGTEESRASMPEPTLMEDAMADVMVTTEDKGIVSVTLPGNGTWKLYQSTEGPRKGQWLIFLITP
jgi:hypothetical protein